MGVPIVNLEFPGEIRFAGDIITVGDVNVTKVLRSALGGQPRLHGKLLVKFEVEPLEMTVASSTMGGDYQEPPEVEKA